MRGIKYLVCLGIFFVGLLIIAESYIFHIDNFYTRFSNTTMYLPTDVTGADMKNDILQQAEKYGIDIFTVIYENESFLRSDYVIYGTDNVEVYLNNNLQLESKLYDSFFMGERGISFHKFGDIPNMSVASNYYMIGEPEQIQQFKISLIDKYSGNHPKVGEVNHELRNNAVFIWIIITVVILLISFYDISMRKKENLLRISFGERISMLIFKNVLLDSFVFSLCFIVSILILRLKTNVYFHLPITLSFFCLLLLANACLYFNFNFYRPKEVFVTARGSQRLLTFNYGVKIITTIIMITLLNGNIKFIYESVNLYRQKSFFAERADYEYIELGYMPTRDPDGKINYMFSESEQIRKQFYQTFFSKAQALVLSYDMDYALNKSVLIINKNAYDYLANEIPSLKKQTLMSDIYFLIPESLAKSVDIIDGLKRTVEFSEGDNFAYSYDVIYYPERVNLINIKKGRGYETKWAKSPIIIYRNIDENTAIRTNPDTFSSYLLETMYRISESDFKQFITDNNLEDQFIMKTNVWESYVKAWNSMKRILYVNTIFTILMLVMNFLIVRTVIRFEYEVNAIELALKKVMGFHVMEKNRKIILATFITSLLSIFGSVIGAYFLEIGGLVYILIGGAITVFIELAVIVFYVKKIENAKITNILKGGNI